MYLTNGYNGFISIVSKRENKVYSGATETDYRMKNSIILLSKVTEKLFGPVTRHLGIFTIIAVIPFLILYVVTSGSAKERSLSACLLATEMYNEVKPGSEDAIRYQAEMLRRYVECMEQGQLAALQGLLYPVFSPKKQLNSALITLQRAAYAGDEEAHKAIQEAARQVDKFSQSSEGVFPGKVRGFKAEDLPDWLLYDIEKAIDLSHRCAQILEKRPTVRNARLACQKNRETVVLLAIARFRYDNREKLLRFADDLKLTYRYTLDVAKKAEDPMTREILLQDAMSQTRRLKIIEARLSNDPQKVKMVLQEAISKLR